MEKVPPFVLLILQFNIHRFNLLNIGSFLWIFGFYHVADFFTFLNQISFNSTFKETWSDNAIKLKFGLSWNYHKILLRINMILESGKKSNAFLDFAFLGNRFKFMVHGHFHLSLDLSPPPSLRAWHFGLETSRFWNGIEKNGQRRKYSALSIYHHHLPFQKLG